VINKERSYPYKRTWRQAFDSGFIRWAAGLTHLRSGLENLAAEEAEDGGDEWMVDAWLGVM